MADIWHEVGRTTQNLFGGNNNPCTIVFYLVERDHTADDIANLRTRVTPVIQYVPSNAYGPLRTSTGDNTQWTAGGRAILTGQDLNKYINYSTITDSYDTISVSHNADTGAGSIASSGHVKFWSGNTSWDSNTAYLTSTISLRSIEVGGKIRVKSGNTTKKCTAYQKVNGAVVKKTAYVMHNGALIKTKN